jgi:hypothetical protein
MIKIGQFNLMLKNASISRFLLSRREKKTLSSFLQPQEIVQACAKGFYAGGRGILLATDRRLLLLDTRFTSVYSRAIRYDRLQHIKFAKKLFDSSLSMKIDNTLFVFKSHSEPHLGRLFTYAQSRTIAQKENDIPGFLDLLDQSAVFELKKKVLLPRHRHGKFPVSLR